MANTSPTATSLDAAQSYTEDTSLDLTDIVITDPDPGDTITARLTLSSVAAGVLSTATSGAVTSIFASGVWSASGALANVNALLAGITFTPAANFNANFSIATWITDGDATVITGSKAITGTAVNDAPTATNLNAPQTYTEDTALDLTDIVVSDIDSANVTAPLGPPSSPAAFVNVAISGGPPGIINLTSLNGANGGFKLIGTAGSSPAPGDWLGTSVSSGDINGDGLSDIITGALYADPGHLALFKNGGKAYVVFGTSDFSFTGSAGLPVNNLNGGSTAGFQMSGPNSPTNALPGMVGTVANSVGDLNGDGLADIGIGRFGTSNYDQLPSFVMGGTNLLGTLPGVSATDGFALTSINGSSNGFILHQKFNAGGFPVLLALIPNAAGDINGDGIGDLVIGSPYADAATTKNGQTYVVLGNSSISALNSVSTPAAPLATSGNAVLKFNGIAGSYSGTAVAGIGDINGDGFADFAIGAGFDNSNGTYSGRVYVVLGDTLANLQSKFANIMTTGFSLSTLGTGTTAGHGFIITGVGASSYAGVSVSAAGDVNGDGHDDFIVGAKGGNGSAYVVFGKSGGFSNFNFSALDGSNGITIKGWGGKLGWSVGSAGDFNGDGYGDVIVGSYGANQAYVIYGDTPTTLDALHGTSGFSVGSSSTALNLDPSTNGVALQGAGSSLTGASVANAGDTTGSGYDGVVVGAPTFSPTGGFQNGQVYVVLGGSQGAVAGNLTATGNNQSLHAGTGGATLDGAGFSGVALLGGAGSDTLKLHGSNSGGDPLGLNTTTGFKELNVSGGHGVDTLQLTAPGQALNFALLEANRAFGTPSLELSGIEKINLAGNGTTPDTLTLRVQDVLNMSGDNIPGLRQGSTLGSGTPLAANDHTLVVTGNVGGASPDSVTSTGWGASVGTVNDGALVYNHYQSGTAHLLIEQGIAVSVTGVNNNNPVFTSSAAPSVVENTTAVVTLAATDADLPAQTVTFSITGGADQAKFQIVPGNQLQFIAAPNFEAPTDAGANNVYDLQVTANDGAGRTTVQNVAVSVTAVNDNNPAFTSSATPNVAENTTAVVTLAATDADQPAQTVTFSLTGGADQAKFQIVAGNQLRFIAAPDFEARTDAGANNVYDVQVTANDGAGRTTPQSIAVTVTNVGVLAITSPSAFSVAENTTAVATVTATSESSITFSITGGADAARFAIDTNTGALSFIAAPDFEAPTDVGPNNVYGVQVTANDGAATQSQSINVTVTGVNDNSPVFTSSAAPSFAENGVGTVVTFTATDADLPAALTFSLTGGADQAKFQIVSGNQLRFLAAPNFEAPTDAGGNNVYDVQVTANDGAGRTTVQNVAASVTNVNELPVVGGLGGTVAYTAGAAATAIDSAITVTDVDNLNLARATVSITSGFVAGDLLNFTSQNGITGSFNSSTGTLTLTGSTTIANYKTALESITFSTGTSTTAGIRSITYTADDDLAAPLGPPSSPAAFVNVAISGGPPGIINLTSLNGANGGFKLIGTAGSSPAPGDWLGTSVSSGDINGDGLSDIITGALYADPGHLALFKNGGKAYVVFGTSDFSFTGSAGLPVNNLNGGSTAGFQMSGPNSPTNALPGMVGTVANSVGDLNGDGLADIGIGRFGTSNYDQLPSFVMGGTNLLGTLPGVSATDGFALTSINGSSNGFILHQKFNAGGFPVLLALIPNAAGDINGDGIGDLVIGSPYADAATTKNGQTYVVLGNSSISALNSVSTPAAPLATSGNAVLKFNGIAGSYSGTAVAGIGDINGDGFADFAIGAGFDNSNGTYSGRVYVVLGDTLANLQSKFANIMTTGFSLSTLGTGTTAGHGFIITGVGASSYAGVSVSAAGDVNGDGHDDFIVGAKGGNGSAYVVFGKSGGFSNFNFSALDGSNGITIKGWGGKLGWSVGSAGDFNGDGYGDVIVGSYGANQAYVIYGDTPTTLDALHGTSGFSVGSSSTALNLDPSTNGVALQGAGSSLTGASVANAGDTTGSGYDGVVVGAPTFSPTGGFQNGQVYVVLGGSQGAVAGNLTATGNNQSLHAGTGGATLDGAGFSGVALLGGAGSDTLKLHGSNSGGDPLGLNTTTGFKELNVSGGHGVDTLQLTAPGQALNFALLEANRAFGTPSLELSGIEKINLAGNGTTPDTLTLRVQDVLNMSGDNIPGLRQGSTLGSGTPLAANDHTLVVTGNVGGASPDSVTSTGWGASVGTVNDGALVYNHYQSGTAHLLIEQNLAAAIT